MPTELNDGGIAAVTFVMRMAISSPFIAPSNTTTFAYAPEHVVAFVGASVADRFRMQENTEPVREWFALRGRRSRVGAGRPTGRPASALVADQHKQ